MKGPTRNVSRVGVRELRQNLSVYLRRVREGESLEVTDRGTSVALLIPLPEVATPLESLIAMGRATPAKGDLLELGLPEGVPGRDLSEALEQSREERL
jgi:prevent-host-death family protein